MAHEQQKAIIEAILFLREEPVKADKLAAVLEITSEEVRGLLGEMQQECIALGRGLRIFEIAGGYGMGSAPELAPYLEKALGEEGSGNLSPAAMETLAIIAYKQPLTRVEIEAVRGVRCEHILDNLLKRRLIRISGRKEAPGRPLIYKTTSDFLKYFGLMALDDLPPLAGSGFEK